MYILTSLIILGLGYGFYQSPNNKMLLSVTPLTFKTQVSATMTLTKNLGSVFGNAFAGLIISYRHSPNSLSGKVRLTGSQAASSYGIPKNLPIWSYFKCITFNIRFRLRQIRWKYFSRYFKGLKEFTKSWTNTKKVLKNPLNRWY